MGLRADDARDAEAVANRHPLDGVDRHHGARKACLEARVPGRVRPESRDGPERAQLEHAAEALVRLARAVDLRHHRLAGGGVETPHG